MKNPTHPGEPIQDNLADLGLSVAETASGLRINHQQLHNVIAGRSALSPEMALREEQALGGTADAWTRMQGNYDMARLRAQGPAQSRPSGVTRRLTGREHPP